MSTLNADIQLRRGKFALDVQFSCPADGITVVFGPSGAGKSTLLTALAGLRKPYTATIIRGGKSLDSLPPHRRGIGLVFQNARLFPHLTVRQNIEYAWRRAAEERRLRLEEVFEFFDIGAFLDRPVDNLSGGEQNRVALARALVARPDILLLDEPFAALDGPRRQDLIGVLLKAHRDYHLPMLVVTHNIDDAAALGSHLVALNDGRVVVSGPFQTASRAPSFQALLDSKDTGVALDAGALRTARNDDVRAIWLRADQVLLAAELPRAISARNILEGQIKAIETGGDGSIVVTLMTIAGTIQSRITPAAMRDLNLVIDQTAWALVKAHAL